jgi:catechol 2,3-dioxygenase-like lactoylglutathione lyase family enzyme
MRIHLLSWIVLAGMLVSTGASGWAQLPDFYKTMGGALWVVKDASRPIAAWQNVGLEDIRDHGRITLDSSGRHAARFVTGRLGSFAVEILQPATGDPVFDGFLAFHHDGVFAVLYVVPDPQQLESETARLRGLGVRVLHTLEAAGGRYTFFDTEPYGKYVLGLVSRPQVEPGAGSAKVTHLGLVIRKAAPVSEYWHKLGFPEMTLANASPREDGRYHGKPLLLPFVVGWQNYSHPTYEWIIPPQDPPNCYDDFLRAHGEGVQHMGLPVDNLDSALERYAKFGWSPVQSGAWGEVGKPNSGRYAYMDTDVLGVSLELIQAYH